MGGKQMAEINVRASIAGLVWQIAVSAGDRVHEDDPIVIMDGPFKDLEGKIGEIDEDRGKVKVMVAMFGRETPVELDFLQIRKL